MRPFSEPAQSPSTRLFACGRKRRRGTVAVFMALSMTVLLGVVALGVDYGVLLADKNHVQRAVDAAALAGADQLKMEGDQTDMSNARRIAVATAGANGLTINPNSISFDQNATRIRVPGLVSRQLFFARVMGLSTSQVSAVALAEVVPADKPTTIPIVPIGITWNTYLSHVKPLNTAPQVLTLVRQTDTTYDLNKFVVFDLRDNSAKSPAAMVDQLLNPGAQTVALGTFETTLNATDGTVGSKFQAAIASVFQRSAAAPWNDTWTGDLFSSTGIRYDEILGRTARRDNPRVMYLVINPDNSLANSGTFNTQIQGFAPVYVESFQSIPLLSGGSSTGLIVRFLPPATGSESDGRDPGAAYSGLRIVRLVG